MPESINVGVITAERRVSKGFEERPEYKLRVSEAVMMLTGRIFVHLKIRIVHNKREGFAMRTCVGGSSPRPEGP